METEIYCYIEDLKTELKPLLDFFRIERDSENEKAYLFLNVPFYVVRNYFPEINKKQFVKLMDYCSDNPRIVFFTLFGECGLYE